MASKHGGGILYQTTPHQLGYTWQRGLCTCNHVPKSRWCKHGSDETTKLGNRQTRQGKATMRQPPGWERMDEIFHCGGSGAEETGTVHGTGATLDSIYPRTTRYLVDSGKSAGQRD